MRTPGLKDLDVSVRPVHGVLAPDRGAEMTLEILEAHPAGEARAGPPFLLVHGAWHAAWCWADHVLPLLAAAGHDAYAMSLRGHGGSPARRSLRLTSLGDYVEDVAAAVERVGGAPVLVGHSMGGLLVQRFLAAGGRATAGVLLASVPPRGALGVTLRVARRCPLAFLRANLTLRLWPVVGTPARAKDALLPDDLGAAEVRAIFERLQDESYRAYLGMLAPRVEPSRVRVPILVLGAGADRLFTQDEVRATARAYGVEAEIVPGAAHDLMLDPALSRVVAGRMVEWVRRLGAREGGAG